MDLWRKLNRIINDSCSSIEAADEFYDHCDLDLESEVKVKFTCLRTMNAVQPKSALK
jgi:hypothetical protein